MTRAIVAAQDEAAIAQHKKQLPHALLVVAEPGLDAVAVIEELARAEPSDVRVIEPLEDKRSISVEQVRDFVATTRTYAARRRVMIVRPASAMTLEAQNSLLKTLEEPSDGLHIILEVESTDDVLPTVVSRCQTLHLHRTSPAQDVQLLDSLHVAADVRQQMQFLAAGRPALIRELAENKKVFAAYQGIAKDAKLIVSEITPASLAAAMTYSADRTRALQLVDVTLAIARAQLRTNGLSAHISRLIDAATNAEMALKRNGHAKLALLMLAVR